MLLWGEKRIIYYLKNTVIVKSIKNRDFSCTILNIVVIQTLLNKFSFFYIYKRECTEELIIE